MKYLTENGCFGSSLQCTCLIMGIVFLLIETISTIIAAIYSTLLIYVLVVGIIYIAAAALLILATIMEKKFLCIPIIIVFVISVVESMYWIVRIIIIVTDHENAVEIEALAVSLSVSATGLIIVAEIVVISYVISYYKELGAQ